MTFPKPLTNLILHNTQPTITLLHAEKCKMRRKINQISRTKVAVGG